MMQALQPATLQEPPEPQQQQRTKGDRRTHWDRQEEKEQRGEWGTAGAEQRRWNDRWKASQASQKSASDYSVWQGKYSQW